MPNSSYQHLRRAPAPPCAIRVIRRERDECQPKATLDSWVRSSSGVAAWIDNVIIDGVCVGLVRGGTDFTGRALRLLQSGNLQTYAFLFALGVAVLLFFALGR